MKKRQPQLVRELCNIRGDREEGREQSSVASKRFGEYVLVSS